MSSPAVRSQSQQSQPKTPPAFSRENIQVDPAALAKVPSKWAVRFQIFPLQWDKDILRIAISSPWDAGNLQEIEFYLQIAVLPVSAPKQDIQELIRTHYGVGAQIIDEMLEKKSEEGVPAGEMPNETLSDISIGKFVEHILRQACEERATDIHIEPYQEIVKVRYRIDGLLYDAKVPQELKHFKDAILSRIKILAHLNIAQRRLPQDGRFKFKIDDRELDCRVSVLPTAFGEGVVIRLLNGLRPCQLKELGLAHTEEDILRGLLLQEHGIVFVTGPTGSGKTTTLYSCLTQLNREDRKIITIEDPIEYQLPGIMQVQVHPGIGLSFANGLRSMLRHDPDIMMVGEVRDVETARTAVQIALTGHLVFSTLHTNDAASAVTRLLDMGIEPYLIASSVECFIAQRLVRVLCPHCRRETRLASDLRRHFPYAARDTVVFEPHGCESCRFTGYQGREAIYEMLVITDAIRSRILSCAPCDEIKKCAIGQGMKTLRQSGWEKTKEGKTTCAEVLRVTQKENE
jgi:type II secretory ATPase GspE/PulE/Tfp pilus assembly ATPase PilB-like protein